MPYIPRNGGPHIPYGLLLANGHFSELGGIHKYGYNEDIDTLYETVWEQGGAVTFPTTAANVGITSGTQAAGNSNCKIRIVGLDGDYNQVDEVLTLDSSGDATSTNTYLRINRAFLVGGKNLTADVDLEIGSTTVVHLDTDHQQTMQCIYTVPAGKTAYIVSLAMGSSVKDKNIEAIFKVTNPNGVTRSREYVAFTDQLTKDYQIPIKVNEKHDIELQAKSSSANANVFGSFDIILEDN